MSLPNFRRPLAREITVILVIKVMLITLAGFFLFGSSQRLHIDTAVMDRHFFADEAPR